MKLTQLARRLGLDGNPLRRRSDKLAAGLTAGALAAFLMGAPFLAVATASWAGHAALAQQQQQRGWQQVPAVLLQNAAQPESTYGGYFTTAWVRARWQAPGGRVRSGEIPVTPGLTAGHKVQLWVDAAGTPSGPPTSRHAVAVRKAAAGAFAVIVLGVVLCYLVAAGRALLDRGRMTAWEREWAAIEPHWARRFRSRG